MRPWCICHNVKIELQEFVNHPSTSVSFKSINLLNHFFQCFTQFLFIVGRVSLLGRRPAIVASRQGAKTANVAG